MKIIFTQKDEKMNADPKASRDIVKILNENYKIDNNVLLISESKLYKVKLLMELIKNMFYKDIIIVQNPILVKINLYKYWKSKNKILIIHDIYGLRRKNNDFLKKEIACFKEFDYIIVHNEKMKKFLVNNKIEPEKIYILECFDYLCEGKKNENKNDSNKLEVCYAGNLKREKCPFIYQIDSSKINFSINLYGIGIDKDLGKNLIYKGAYTPEDLPDKFRGGERWISLGW